MCILLLLKFCTQQDFCITCFNISKIDVFQHGKNFGLETLLFRHVFQKIGNSAVILKDFVSYKVHKCI